MAPKQTVTLGPWHVACDSYGKVQHSRKACVYATKRNAEGETTEILNVAQRIENWKDAYVMAAAPDLLQALKDLLPMWESGIEAPWIEAARLAIAKAEGWGKL